MCYFEGSGELRSVGPAPGSLDRAACFPAFITVFRIAFHSLNVACVSVVRLLIDFLFFAIHRDMTTKNEQREQNSRTSRAGKIRPVLRVAPDLSRLRRAGGAGALQVCVDRV